MPKMPSITLLMSHSQPHSTPLGMVNRLNNARCFVDRRNGTSGMVQHRYFASSGLIWTILQIPMLALLLSFQIDTRRTRQSPHRRGKNRTYVPISGAR